MWKSINFSEKLSFYTIKLYAKCLEKSIPWSWDRKEDFKRVCYFGFGTSLSELRGSVLSEISRWFLSQGAFALLFASGGYDHHPHSATTPR
jgi:hypothetical protein